MKTFLLQVLGGLALSVAPVIAFPSAALKAAISMDGAVEKRCPFAENHAKEKRVLGVGAGFDPVSQHIDVSGAHVFVPPGSSDLRGVCPGLNALANHNYLPHNGWATLQQYVNATSYVYGLSPDFAEFLSTYAAIMSGDPLSVNPGWSMGGPPGALGSGSLVGLLGSPQGIDGSHNKYEGDCSPTRPDLYLAGQDYLLDISQFTGLFNLQPNAATANYNIDVLAQHHHNRFQQSVSTNPYFFNAPFSGAQVSLAGLTFIYRFMSNKSASAPEGILNQDVLKSFFAISGKPGSFTVQQGWERIPSNWYKRAIGDEYNVAFLEQDILRMQSLYPDTVAIGGNTGTVNSFTGLSISDFTGGVYDISTLFQGNNLQCFVYQALQQESPDVLKGLFSDITSPLAQINSQVTSLIGGLGCPTLAKIDKSQFNKFPGYSQSYNGYKGGNAV